jgi:hypothetical protein
MRRINMYKVYKVLSGEEWNEQNRPEDFEKVEFVCDVETREEIKESTEKKDEKTKKNDFLKILNNKELIEDIDRRNRKLSSPGKETVPIKEQLRDISEKLDKTDNSELKAVFENFETDVSKYSSVGEFEDSLENKIRAFNLIYSRVNNEKSKEED